MIELHKDKAAVLKHTDVEQAIIPTTATVALVDAADSTIEAPVVTLPTASTTVAAGSTDEILNVVSAAGLVVGEPLQLVDAGNTYVVVPSRIVALAVTLREALPITPAVGATVKALTMSATFAAVGSVKPNSMIRWQFDDGTTYRQHQEIVDVVRWPFEAVVSAADVARQLALVGTSKSDLFCEDVADAVNNRIRAYLRATGRRPDLVADPTAFELAGRAGVDMALAERAVVSFGDDPIETRQRLRDAFRADMQLVIDGLSFVDSNDDGKLDPDARAFMGVTRIRR